MTRWLFLVCLLLAPLTGCEDRERDNLFDPENTETGGRPRILSAVAGSGEVQLRWSLEGYRRVAEVRLLRTLGAAPEQIIVRRSPGGSGEYLDQLIENELEGIYRLAVQAPDGGWLYSESDTARTGDAIPWLGDAAGGGLSRLSPDGRDRLFRVRDTYEVLDVAPAADGSVWAADYGFGEVVWVGPDQFRRESWECYGANTLALDPATDLIWVGAFLQQRVYLYDPIGTPVWIDSTAGLVEQLRAAAGGGAWYCARGGIVRRIRADRTLRTWTDFVQPTGLMVDDAGDAWVTDRGADRVERLSSSGDRREVSPAAFVDPVEIESDGAGGAWVSDPGRGGVVHLNETLGEDAFVAVPDAWSLSWDLGHRRLWVARPAVGRIDVWRLTPGESPAWSAALLASLEVGGRPNVLRAEWRR
jgi:hypothetical protein